MARGLARWFQRQARTLEDQPWWDAVEQVAHAVMAGVPAWLVLQGFDLFHPLDFWPALGVALGVAFVGQPYFWAWGLAREIRQNWGVGRDERTLFVIGPLPVNLDMLIDMTAYLIGGTIAGVVSFLL